ncbi:MAG TPA: lytic transglycosylase domain-containing protein [Gemmatimonadaceae bacterium]|nr:lytic transglycosylase domain-containing protein [Gemmatimonadaceae bacterium]
MIPVVCGPLSVLPHSADAWTPGPRPSAIKRRLRNAKPLSYPVMLLACGVLIANVAPRVPVRPLPMSPVIVFAPTVLQRGLELRRDTLVRMLRRKHVDSVTAFEWAREFQTYGEQARVNPKLLVAIAYAESEFNPRATSHAGAIGLMQVLPERDSWREYESRCGKMTPTSLHNPRVNICFGAHIFGEFLRSHHGDNDRALAAYNNGTGEMNSYPDRVYASLAALKRGQ